MQISYEQCESCHNEIAVVIENMKNIIDDIESKCNTLKSNDIWDGSGAAHYTYLFRNILKYFDDIYVQLKKSNVYLEKSYSSYKNIDKNVLSGLSNLGL